MSVPFLGEGSFQLSCPKPRYQLLSLSWRLCGGSVSARDAVLETFQVLSFLTVLKMHPVSLTSATLF